MIRTIATATALALLGGCAYVPFRHHHSEARQERIRLAPDAALPPEVAAVQPNPPPAADIAATEPGAACRLDLVKVLEGRPGSAVLAAEALDLSGARSIRWIRPGDAVTMDFRADRLNIKLTHGNVVKSFACG